MASIIVPDAARARHPHHSDKLTDRLMAAGFVAVVFLITCTDVLGQALPEPHDLAVAAARGARP